MATPFGSFNTGSRSSLSDFLLNVSNATQTGFIPGGKSREKAFNEFVFSRVGVSSLISQDAGAFNVFRSELASTLASQKSGDAKRTLEKLDRDPAFFNQFAMQALAKNSMGAQQEEARIRATLDMMKRTGQTVTTRQLQDAYVQLIQFAEQGGNVSPDTLIGFYSVIAAKQDTLDRYRDRMNELVASATNGSKETSEAIAKIQRKIQEEIQSRNQDEEG